MGNNLLILIKLAANRYLCSGEAQFERNSLHTDFREVRMLVCVSKDNRVWWSIIGELQNKDCMHLDEPCIARFSFKIYYRLSVGQSLLILLTTLFLQICNK